MHRCADPFQGINGPYSSATASTSTPAWPCAGAGKDLWFRYTTGACMQNRIMTFTTCDGASFDTAIEVFSGDCSSLTSIACNDEAGPGGCPDPRFTPTDLVVMTIG